jgi:hypothetical protein
MGCDLLSRTVDSLPGDLNQKFVYNFLDDLVVYSISFAEHLEMFMRLEKAGFTLNCDKVHLAEQEISFFATYFFGLSELRRLRIFHLPRNLRPCIDF